MQDLSAASSSPYPQSLRPAASLLPEEAEKDGETAQEPWRYRFTVYMWAMSVEGTASVRGRT